MNATVIRAEGLGKRYHIGGQQAMYSTIRESLMEAAKAPLRRFRSGSSGCGEASIIWALKDVSFDVQRGEVVGIIGPNGAGKTTLLKILSRITKPTEGSVDIYGRIGSLLEVGTGFHPELTGRDNIYLNGAILGMRRTEINRKFDEIVDFSGIEKFIDTPVKRYSSGMYVRLAFAVAAHLEPEILVVDEVLSVGDAAFQKKSMGKMGEVAHSGRTVLFVSHNMAAVENLCTYCFLLSKGKIQKSGSPRKVIEGYMSEVSLIDKIDLSKRKDRRGTGRLKFTSLTTEGGWEPSPTLSCGAPAALIMEYRGQQPLRNVQVSLSLKNTIGDSVAYFANDLVGHPFENLPSSGKIICRFDNLVILPGIYSVNIYCTVNGELSDWVINAGQISVEEGDLFGTGRLPPEGYGAVGIKHDWEISD